ncbi:MAG: M23 family metallopeptidase [Bacillaceae bacterium]|nr:M23 family metallopeptidase [Bacillaceae bacterium]
MGEKKNKYTIMIIPHSEKHTVTLNIPVIVMQFLTVLVIIGIILFFVGVKNYINLKNENEYLQATRLEMEAVKNKLNDVAYRVETMESSVIELEQLESKIREQNGLAPSESFFNEEKDKRVVMASRSSGGKYLPSAASLVLNETEQSLDKMNEAVPHRKESAQSLINEVEEKQHRLAHTPSIYPAYGRFTSSFGYRRDPFNGRASFHDGIDIANHYNTPIYATADGTVILAQRKSGYGNQIKIYHGYGISTSYSHLARMVVSPGSKVKKGQVIGYMGSTGRSTGPHLHYMVYENGEPVNPMKYLTR